jgi:hypothetical protein
MCPRRTTTHTVRVATRGCQVHPNRYATIGKDREEAEADQRRWDEVDPDTEVARMGEGIGLSEDRSYELFGQLVDEGFVDPGRAYRAGGAMPGSTSRIVGREENMMVIGDDVRLTGKGRAEIQ